MQGSGGNDLRINNDDNQGNAGLTGQQGVSRYVVGEGNTGTSGYYAVIRGGGGGTSTGPGAGGTYGGNQDQASNGNSGSGHDGGAGVPTPRSAGGGGGSGGGGSGATLAWKYQNAGTVSPAGGGGRSSFASSDATGVTQGLRAAVGSVVGCCQVVALWRLGQWTLSIFQPWLYGNVLKT